MVSSGSDAGDWQQICEEGRRLLHEGRPHAAVDLLSRAEKDERGEVAALLGVALFRTESYDDALKHLRAALELRPDNADLQQLTHQCQMNLDARLDVYVPPLEFFDRDTLLHGRSTPRVPHPPQSGHRRTVWERLRYRVGHTIGNLGGVVFDTITKVVGRRYRDAVWTNWYHKRLYPGILTLAHMREQLNEHCLHDTYPPGVMTGFAPPDLERPAGVTRYRTADGSWNRLENPLEGAAGTRFPRNVEKSVIRPADDTDLLEPNPRLISRRLLTRDGDPKTVPFLNLLAANWIQFMNHDWVNHGEVMLDETIEIPLDDDDPARRRFEQGSIRIGRTQPDPTRQESGETTPVTFVNEVTHWWDGSQLYGSDQETQDRLRSFEGGRLTLLADGTLPIRPDGVEDTGFLRNWWVGLSMMHTLFAREHNAICDHLAENYPDWGDERLFNVARLVNAAVMAKIHTIEWTPAILPNEGLAIGLNSNWYGLLTYKFRKPEHRKTVATFNVANPELGGLVGNAINRHDSPFGLAEEFVEVYRLHSLLPESLEIRDHVTGEKVEDIPVPATRQASSPAMSARFGMANLFFSFGKQHPGQLVLNNYPRFMQELTVPGNPVFDLGAIDVLRARERGVPRYNEFRRQLGLNPIREFEDLTDDLDVVDTLREVYGDNVESLDLMIGTLAEDTATRRPTRFGFGETMFQIFILNASRRLQADRFYTDDYRPEVYTPEGMAWVDEASLKTVILRHHPELANTGLANVTNAFEPWDDEAWLDPNRHPLREYDPDLAKDPWRGDAHR